MINNKLTLDDKIVKDILEQHKQITLESSGYKLKKSKLWNDISTSFYGLAIDAVDTAANFKKKD